MKIRGKMFTLGALLSIGSCLNPTSTRAELFHFTVDEALSSLTISGTFAGFVIEPQATGSLATRYGGNIEAEVTSSNIMFTGGSMIAALTNGNWQPASSGTPGSGPANYGGQVVNLFVNGKAAIRNAVFDLTSDILPVSGGTFPAQGLQFNFVPAASSVIDYNYTLSVGAPGIGSVVLSGTSTNSISTNATFVTQGQETVLTVPVDISGSVTVNSPNDVQYRFRGQLVGRASAPSPLQISSFQLSPGQLHFTIATTPSQAYTILGSTNLMDWPFVVDQFTATNNPTVRSIALPTAQPRQFFRVRQD